MQNKIIVLHITLYFMYYSHEASIIIKLKHPYYKSSKSPLKLTSLFTSLKLH